MDRLRLLSLSEVATAAIDDAPAVRARGAELAYQFGEEGERLVAGATKDDDPFVVEAACFSLGEIGARASRDSIDCLSNVATGHPDPLCREAAVAALGAVGHPDGLPAILAATADKPAVRRRAVLALAPFEGAEVDAALERALADRDWQVRQAAEDLTYRSEGFTS
jgi:HEAT repeat protein